MPSMLIDICSRQDAFPYQCLEMYKCSWLLKTVHLKRTLFTIEIQLGQAGIEYMVQHLFLEGLGSPG